MRILLLQPGPAKLDLFQESSGHSVTQVGAGKPMSWGSFFNLWREFHQNPPELLLVTQREFSFLPPHTDWAHGATSFTRNLFRNLEDFFILCLFRQAVLRQIPIALINRSDNGRLFPGTEWFYRRCHAAFVRELHPQPEMALQHLYSPTGGNPQTNKRARRLLHWIDPACPSRRNLEKLRPISLGVSPDVASKIPTKDSKEWDVFFAGDLNEKGLRGRLVDELQSLSGRSDYKILLKQPMPLPDYLAAVASARLTLSPPGMGWDCWRHYESMLAGSIPLMTYPVIQQHHAGIDGEHCFYFSPDPGGLTRCLEKVLAHRERLPHIAEAGRRLVLEKHTFPKLEEYIIRETCEAHARSKV